MLIFTSNSLRDALTPWRPRYRRLWKCKPDDLRRCSAPVKAWRCTQLTACLRPLDTRPQLLEEACPLFRDRLGGYTGPFRCHERRFGFARAVIKLRNHPLPIDNGLLLRHDLGLQLLDERHLRGELGLQASGLIEMLGCKLGGGEVQPCGHLCPQRL